MITGSVAQLITRLTTNRKVPGSNPSKHDFFFILRQLKSINKSEGKGIIELSPLHASFFNQLFFFQSCWL